MATEKVDIFEFLRHVDAGDFDYYPSLSEEQKKTLSMVVASRWMSCTKNAKQLIAVNALVNPFVFRFGTKHKDLLYKLMLIASSGTEKNYKWVGKKKKVSSKPVSCKVVSDYYGISTMVADTYLEQFSLDDVVKCANAIGTEDALIKKIKNEYKQ